jgi:hypothetical protein
MKQAASRVRDKPTLAKNARMGHPQLFLIMKKQENHEGEPLATRPIKRRYKILVVIVGVWLFAMAATLPELTAVWPERKIVRQTFSNYADALVHQKFEEAYGYHDPEFQERVTLDSFVKYQRDVQARFGVLKAVQQEGMTVQKWRNPSRWRASIKADFLYEKATVRFTFELHREINRWTIFSSSGEEQ